MKLQDITFSKAQAPQTLSPGAAAAPHLAKIGAFKAASDAVHTIATKFQDDAVNVATAKHKQVGTDTLRFTAENEVLTRKQLDQLGIGQDIEAKNMDGTDMEVVPRHYWAAVLLESELKTSRSIYEDKLPGHKNEWNRDMAEIDSRTVLAVAEQSGAEAQRYMTDSLVNGRKTAILKGEWDTAAQLQDTDLFKDLYSNSPGLKQLHELEVAQGRENEGFHTMMVQGEYDDIMDLVSDVERKTSLSSDDLRKIYFSAQTQQDKVETDELALEKIAKETNFSNSIVGLIEGTLSMQQIHDMRHSFTPAHLSKLISVGQGLVSDSLAIDSALAQSTMNGFNTELDMAARGVFPEGIDNLEEYQMIARSEVQSNMTRYDDEGGLEAGLSSSNVKDLLTRITDLEEIPFTSRPYKQLVTDMKLRILRADDTGPSYLAQEDTAQLMANAMDDLHEYMEIETAAGKQPNLSKWKTDNMPGYLNKSAKFAYFKLPDGVKNVVKYTNVDGKFAVDYPSTVQDMIARKKAFVENNPGADTSQADKNIIEFENYWKAYGENAGGVK